MMRVPDFRHICGVAAAATLLLLLGGGWAKIWDSRAKFWEAINHFLVNNFRVFYYCRAMLVMATSHSLI